MGILGTIGHFLAKAAPIAAAFIPGIGPLASMGIGALTNGTDAALSGKGLGGSIISGLMGAGSGLGASSLASGLSGGGGLSGLFGGGGGAASVGADGIPNITMTGLPASVTGAASGAGGGIGSTIEKLLLGNKGVTGALTGQGGSGGLLSGLLSPQGLSTLGSGLGGVASADAKNRGTKLSAMLASDQMKLAEQQQRNSDLASLPGQIQKADYLASGGYTPKPNYSSNGRLIPKFDLGLAPISENAKAAGATAEKQLTDRLNTAPTYNDYSSVMNPSATETGLNWASPILSALGASKTPDPYASLISTLLKPQGAAPATTPAPTAPPITPAKPVTPMPGVPPVNPGDWDTSNR